MFHLIESGLDISPVITHEMPYTDFEVAFKPQLLVNLPSLHLANFENFGRAK
jgi:hypothetical protein